MFVVRGSRFNLTHHDEDSDIRTMEISSGVLRLANVRKEGWCFKPHSLSWFVTQPQSLGDFNKCCTRICILVSSCATWSPNFTFLSLRGKKNYCVNFIDHYLKTKFWAIVEAWMWLLSESDLKMQNNEHFNIRIVGLWLGRVQKEDV